MIKESRSIKIKTGTILSKNNLIDLIKTATINMKEKIDIFQIVITFKKDIILKSNGLDIFEDDMLHQQKIKELEFHANDMTTNVHFTIKGNSNFNFIFVESYEQDKAKSIYLQYKELVDSFSRRVFVLRKPFFNILYSLIFFIFIYPYDNSSSKFIDMIITIILFVTSFFSMDTFIPNAQFYIFKTNKKLVSILSWIVGSLVIPFVLFFAGLYIKIT